MHMMCMCTRLNCSNCFCSGDFDFLQLIEEVKVDDFDRNVVWAGLRS